MFYHIVHGIKYLADDILKFIYISWKQILSFHTNCLQMIWQYQNALTKKIFKYLIYLTFIFYFIFIYFFILFLFYFYLFIIIMPEATW